MTQADEIAKLQAECANLQRQVVELRMRMEQQAEAQAALIEHAVSRAVDAKTGGHAITEAQWQWIKDGTEAKAERKKARNAILLHIAQWGIGGTVGFVLYSAWEAIKVKVRQ